MNKHLSLEDILDFTAVSQLNNDTLKLSAKIYRHTATCSECRTALESALRFYEITGKQAVLRGRCSSLREKRIVRNMGMPKKEVLGG